ncbi:MAG: tetratricopeptide repeat protein, partial [Clostridia bacterium]|nr:tetratricopeptide repeat protein [Clostridia bacterium]
LLFFIGLAYRQLERYEEAIEYFEKTLQYNTGHVDTMNEIGICLMSVEAYDEAERYFKEALKADINNPELLCNLGIVYLNKGNLEEAESYLGRSFEVNPEDEITNAWITYLKDLQNKFNN